MSEQEDRVFETETQPESTPQPESKPKRRFKRKKSKHSDLWMVLNTAVVVVVLCNAKEFFRKPVLWVLLLIERKGTGAAGGLGAALLAISDAVMQSGIELMLEWQDFERLAGNADIIITGEGCLDRQTLMGKAPWKSTIRWCLAASRATRS